MAAILAGIRRGQVLVEMNEACAGNMRFSVCTAPRLGVDEVVPAIADDPASVIEMRGEIAYGNEGGVAHGMRNYE